MRLIQPRTYALSAVLTLAAAQAASATTVYTIQLISPVDISADTSTYTSGAVTPMEYSSLIAVNAAGQALGQSIIYNGGLNSVANTAWIYNPGVTGDIFLGLTDASHTSSAGIQNSAAIALNSTGEAIGTSTAYNGTLSLGLDTWFYNPASTAASKISLLDMSTMTGTASTYSFSNSNTSSRSVQPVAISDSGFVTGTATIYSGTTNLGTAAWLFNSTTNSLIQIGATPQGVGSSGRVSSSVKALSSNGIVIGISTRYVTGTSTSEGQDSWYYDPNAATPATVQVGLSGSPTNANYTLSAYMAGTTYTGLAYSYTTNGNTTQSSNIIAVNAAGYMSGTSTRYSSTNSNLGNDAWLYNKNTNTYTIIGLDGTNYDEASGYHLATVTAMDSSGDVAGTNSRWTGTATSLGNDGWVYYPSTGTTKVLALTGGVYNSTAATGYHSSQVSKINALGEVAGYSTRYNGSSSAPGQDAWIYDPSANSGAGQIFPINLSTSSNGISAYSSVMYLSDTGLALGVFYKYTGTSYVLDAFSWSENPDGTATAVDLGIQIPNAANENWASLASAISMDSAGSIYGTGTRITDAAGATLSSSSREIYVAKAALLGDANTDGVVDLSDLNIVLNNLGTTTSAWTSGNFDGAPTIDLTDLNDVLNNLGTNNLSAAVASPVPEPTSLAILALGGALTLQRRKGRAMARNG